MWGPLPLQGDTYPLKEGGRFQGEGPQYETPMIAEINIGHIYLRGVDWGQTMKKSIDLAYSYPRDWPLSASWETN